MAILSASRRTDIPAFYSEWFFQRIKEGKLCTRNPFMPNRVTKYLFKPEDIDCIVFWTKNPIPMMENDYLNRLAGIPFYFQYTLNAYGKDLEAGLPDKAKLVEAFKKLSSETNGNVVWRYDPIMFTKQYDLNWHMQAFTDLCEQLAGYTDRCVISFVDLYDSVKSTLQRSSVVLKQESYDNLVVLCEHIAKTAEKNGMKVFTCAEKLPLEDLGIGHSSCIDKGLVEKVAGYPISAYRSVGQRKECGCIESIDVGKYSTCKNGCKYCYACKGASEANSYDVTSPFLCDTYALDKDTVTAKHLKSLKDESVCDQLSFV